MEFRKLIRVMTQRLFAGVKEKKSKQKKRKRVKQCDFNRKLLDQCVMCKKDENLHYICNCAKCIESYLKIIKEKGNL